MRTLYCRRHTAMLPAMLLDDRHSMWGETESMKTAFDCMPVKPTHTPATILIGPFLMTFSFLKLPRRIRGLPIATLNDNRHYSIDGDLLTVAGHGLRNSEDNIDETPNIYYQVTMPYIEDCSRFYPTQLNVDLQFCACDMPLGGSDACQGDSGTGVFDEKGIFIGLVSWGIGCGRPRKPSVYARISSAERWIAHMISQHTSAPPSQCTDIHITLKVDDYPEETGLTLLDLEDPDQLEVVALLPGSLGARPRQTLLTTNCGSKTLVTMDSAVRTAEEKSRYKTGTSNWSFLHHLGVIMTLSYHPQHSVACTVDIIIVHDRSRLQMSWIFGPLVGQYGSISGSIYGRSLRIKLRLA
jgi:hypothetical protein